MSKKSIIEEFEKYKGQSVIASCDYKVYRLIAVADDDFDYYWVFWDGRKTMWQSCCGGFIPLKGKIDDKHYNEIKRIAKINHHDSPELWSIKDEKEKKKLLKLNTSAKKEVEKLKGKDKYLTKVCWDMN